MKKIIKIISILSVLIISNLNADTLGPSFEVLRACTLHDEIYEIIPKDLMCSESEPHGDYNIGVGGEDVYSIPNGNGNSIPNGNEVEDDEVPPNDHSIPTVDAHDPECFSFYFIVSQRIL